MAERECRYCDRPGVLNGLCKEHYSEPSYKPPLHPIGEPHGAIRKEQHQPPVVNTKRRKVDIARHGIVYHGDGNIE